MDNSSDVQFFYCTYHNKVAFLYDALLCCSDGGETYGNHCTCVGPFFTKKDAEIYGNELGEILDCGYKS